MGNTRLCRYDRPADRASKGTAGRSGGSTCAGVVVTGAGREKEERERGEKREREEQVWRMNGSMK